MGGLWWLFRLAYVLLFRVLVAIIFLVLGGSYLVFVLLDLLGKNLKEMVERGGK